jgi:hypothetical protein
MDFNRNKKMDQIHDTTLIVGVDIGKKKHVARAVDDRGKELAKPSSGGCSTPERGTNRGNLATTGSAFGRIETG